MPSSLSHNPERPAPVRIHPRAVDGRFHRLRRRCLLGSQILFFGLPWLRWDGRQAILFDFAHERFYLFGLVLWPQDAVLLALLLIGAAAGLFLATALAGRIFCGFLCPQTVYTAIFVAIEAAITGDHRARARLDAAPWRGGKLLRRGAVHLAWGLVAGLSGIAFVGWFVPVDALLADLLGATLGPWPAFWIVACAGSIYLLAGLARTAVCLHMCPYARFQGVMFDPATRTVAYDGARGEPRAPLRQAAPRGDCVDCGLCVQVCPTGIDIRDGLQYACINCGLCADACDAVMTHLGARRGLIRFAAARRVAAVRRPRVLIYAALLLASGLASAAWLSGRPPLLLDVVRDRGVLWRETGAGIENAYTARLTNRTGQPLAVELRIDGSPGARLAGTHPPAIMPGAVLHWPLTVTAPAHGGAAGMTPLHVVAHDAAPGPAAAPLAAARSTFARP